MFSQASVILFTISLMDTRSLVILVGYSVTPCYGAVVMHATGMLSCLKFFLFKKSSILCVLCLANVASLYSCPHYLYQLSVKFYHSYQMSPLLEEHIFVIISSQH